MEEHAMENSQKLRVSNIRRGDTISVRARKGGLLPTQEDHIQLQTLEYQITNTDHFNQIAEDQEICL
jgi:hypothetical protein